MLHGSETGCWPILGRMGVAAGARLCGRSVGAGGTSRSPQTPSTGPLRGQTATAVGDQGFPYARGMGASISLGRIAGIQIGVNWSWLVVFALITWSLADGIFPDQNPGLSRSTYWAMAIAAAILFFSSLLLHELGHAFQARREGMQIDGITLWLFGGVAKFRGMFPSAGAEFRIAIAGPFVSLVLGGVFVLAAWRLNLPDVVDGIAAWLGYINLLLLIFNLLPALPLDGGRVLRAVLWQLKGEFGWATVVAANVGRAFGVLMIVGGVGMLFVQSAFSGIWLAFIGFFLLQAAGGELRFLAARGALEGLRVSDLMVRDPVTVGPDLTLVEFLAAVGASRRDLLYPVVEDGHVLGLLSVEEVAAVPRDEWGRRRIRDSMLPRGTVPALDEDEALIDALQELGDSDAERALVVADGDRFVGLVAAEDLLGVLQLRSRRRPGFSFRS
jgi:Zn-dependent protease/predicted transcriptional regulator